MEIQAQVSSGLADKVCMAWEISHSPEAWEAARRNLGTWERAALIEALADDAFEAQEEAGNDTGQLAADTIRELLDDASHPDLVEMAITSITVHNTCSNGGFDFYIDRKGYHTVPVDFTAEDGDWEIA